MTDFLSNFVSCRPSPVAARRLKSTFSFGQLFGAETIKLKRAPQPPSQPYVAKTAHTFQPDLVEPLWHWLARSRRRLEQFVLLVPSRNPQGQSASPRASLRVELAKLRHRLLHHLAATPHRAHQTPVAVRLAILANCRVSQVHRRESRSQNRTDLCTQQPQVGWHYTRIANTPASVPSANARHPPSIPLPQA